MNKKKNNKKNKSERRTIIGLLHDPFKGSRVPCVCNYIRIVVCGYFDIIDITYVEVRVFARELCFLLIK